MHSDNNHDNQRRQQHSRQQDKLSLSLSYCLSISSFLHLMPLFSSTTPMLTLMMSLSSLCISLCLCVSLCVSLSVCVSLSYCLSFSLSCCRSISPLIHVMPLCPTTPMLTLTSIRCAHHLCRSPCHCCKQHCSSSRENGAARLSQRTSRSLKIPVELCGGRGGGVEGNGKQKHLLDATKTWLECSYTRKKSYLPKICYDENPGQIGSICPRNFVVANFIWLWARKLRTTAGHFWANLGQKWVMKVLTVICPKFATNDCWCS